MRRGRQLFWLVPLFASAVTLAVQARQFSASTAGVRLDVLVLDGHRPVSGLAANDFEVRDNGVVQKVDGVSAVSDVHLLVVLDVSGSVEGQRLQRLLDGANRLISRATAADRVTVVGFSHQLRLIESAAGALRPEMLPVGGATALHDAVFAAMLMAGEDPRPALMIVLTDGIDTASWLAPRRVLDMAHRADVVVYPVAVDYDLWRRSRSLSGRRAVENLARLAIDTGGRLFPTRADVPVTAPFLEILDEYRQRYVLTYAPTSVDRRGWHDIQVRLKGRAGTAFTRRGYEVP